MISEKLNAYYASSDRLKELFAAMKKAEEQFQKAKWAYKKEKEKLTFELTAGERQRRLREKEERLAGPRNRRRAIVESRNAGATYKEIGAIYGITPSRAQQLYADEMARREAKKKHEAVIAASKIIIPAEALAKSATATE